MITIYQSHLATKAENTRIALYVQTKDQFKILPIYLMNTEDAAHKMPTNIRRNICDYIDMEIFRPDKSKRYPELSTREVEIVVDMISRRLLPENWPRGYRNQKTEFYFRKIYDDIQRKCFYMIIAQANMKFFACPTVRKNQRDDIVVYGPSGIGKSYWCADYITTYNNTYNMIGGKPVEKGKERKIYLLSQKPQDEALDKLDYVIRIKESEFEEFITIDSKIPEVVDRDCLNEEKKKLKLENEEQQKLDEFDNYQISTFLAENEDGFKLPNARGGGGINDKKDGDYLKDITHFANSLFVFDDIETMFDEKLQAKLYRFKDFLIKLGRSSNIDIIYATHSLDCKNAANRMQMREMTALVIFPNSGSLKQASTILKDYFHLDQSTISKIFTPRNSRWVMATNFAPKAVLSESELWLIGNVEIRDKRYKNATNGDLLESFRNNNNNNVEDDRYIDFTTNS